jgi:hypothetical protein
MLVDGNSNDDNEKMLVCPVCGDEYMHHGNVRIFSRFGEDKDGLQVDVSNSVKVEPVRSGAIPGRRDAIHISFTCENGCASLLQIMQHKGNTFFEWLQPS